jgi:hypothetical protein
MGCWFGRKSAPETRPFVPVWLQGESETGNFPRGYEAQLDEVYRRNPVGLRAVRLVAGMVGGLPLFGAEAALKLVGAEGLLERVAAALLLHGNAYVQLIADGHNRPGELNLLRPERVSVATDAAGWPAAYVYRAGGKVVRIAKDDALGRRQVAHLKALNPADDHYDPDRDYQTGQMRASTGSGGARDERIELPVVLTAGGAKQLVEQALARRWRAADQLRVGLPPSRMVLRPGDAIQLPEVARAWLVRSVSIEGMAVSIEAEAAPVAVPVLPADPGRVVSDPDVPIGRTELALFELPTMGDAPDASVRAHVAATNAGRWKSVPVELALGSDPLAALAITRRATLGVAETMLAERAPLVLDELSTVDVRLTNPASVLLNADWDALMAGANLAVLGGELIQFGRAEQLGAGLYRLSSLLRGRRGTEWATALHAVNEVFCVVDQSVAQSFEISASAAGAILTGTAHGISDVAPLPSAARMLSGESLRPLSPCHLKLWREGTSVLAQWVRRSHRGWAWADGVGVAGDPFPELYRLTVAGPSGELVIETSASNASVSEAELPASIGQSVTLAVAMIGPIALSREASESLIL